MDKKDGFMRKSISFGLAMALVVLSGCSTQGVKRFEADPLEQPRVDARLIKALKEVVEEVKEEKHKIVAINATRARHVTEIPQDPIPELDLPVHIPDWHGPAETLMRKIAFWIGYRFEVQGEPPNGVSPTVNANYNGTPLRVVFADIDRQIGDKVVMTFDASRRVLTMTYR